MGKYSEVSLNVKGYDNNGANPLAKRFRYEYALYRVVSELFASVVCRSMCIESLELYFSELPHSTEEGEGDEAASRGNTRSTQESLLEEMRNLVDRDVVGNIRFPQINICAAEAAALPEKDGSHTFVFSDGIYGFSLHFEKADKKHPKRITVEDRGLNAPKKAAVETDGKTPADPQRGSRAGKKGKKTRKSAA